LFWAILDWNHVDWPSWGWEWEYDNQLGTGSVIPYSAGDDIRLGQSLPMLTFV